MTDWRNVWNNQKTYVNTYILSALPYCSGHITFGFWNTDTVFPNVHAYLIGDSPEMILDGYGNQTYDSKSTWRLVYRMLATDNPSNDYIALMSGVGALANIPMDHGIGGSWHKTYLDNVDLNYVSPGIAEAVVLEGAVDIVLVSEAH